MHEEQYPAQQSRRRGLLRKELKRNTIKYLPLTIIINGLMLYGSDNHPIVGSILVAGICGLGSIFALKSSH